jgi:hypothetical protein
MAKKTGVKTRMFSPKCLVTFNEADDLHLATSARAYQRIDFVDPLDQHVTPTEMPACRNDESQRSLAGEIQLNGPVILPMGIAGDFTTQCGF